MEKLGSGIQKIRLFQLFMSLASASKMTTETLKLWITHSQSANCRFVVSNRNPNPNPKPLSNHRTTVYYNNTNSASEIVLF
jgi:hypothetical protein